MSAVLLALGCTGQGAPQAVVPEPSEAPLAEEPHPPLPPDSVVQAVLVQGVLDNTDVKPMLHLEVAENLPLKVHAVDDLAEGLKGASAGGKPVAVVPEDEARFRFTRREALSGPRVRVHFEVPAEGMTGHVVLKLDDYEWSSIEAEVVER